MKPRTATVFIDDVAWTAHFDYSPGYPACHTQRNGDPGWDAAPADACVNYLTRAPDVKQYDVPKEHELRIYVECMESAMQEDEERLHTYYDERERRCE